MLHLVRGLVIQEPGCCRQLARNPQRDGEFERRRYEAIHEYSPSTVPIERQLK
jgi:hypothetical protein